MNRKTLLSRLLFCVSICFVAFMLVIAVIAGARVFKSTQFEEGLRTLAGEPFEKHADLVPEDAQSVLVTFWNSECQACTYHLRNIITATNEMEAGVFIILQNVADSQYSVEKKLREVGIENMQVGYVVAMGAAGLPKGVEAVPHTYLLEPSEEGLHIVADFSGALGVDALVEIANSLFPIREPLAELPIPFWDGSLVIGHWLHIRGGHHILTAYYDQEHGPSWLEVCKLMLDLAEITELGPGGSLALHVVIEHEVYGQIVGITYFADWETYQGFGLPYAEEVALDVLMRHFLVVMGSDYTGYMQRPPLWSPDDAEMLGSLYSYYAAKMYGHPLEQEYFVAARYIREARNAVQAEPQETE